MSQILTQDKATELLRKLQYQKAQMGQLSIQDEYFKQALEKLPRWIACSERMPPHTNNICLMIWVKGEGAYLEAFDAKHFTHHHVDDVTHWMTLPEAPL